MSEHIERWAKLAWGTTNPPNASDEIKQFDWHYNGDTFVRYAKAIAEGATTDDLLRELAKRKDVLSEERLERVVDAVFLWLHNALSQKEFPSPDEGSRAAITALLETANEQI